MTENSLIQVHNFSSAFEQMCSIVAIGKTKNHQETLKQLILQCMVILPEDTFYSEKDFFEPIRGLFGLHINEYAIYDCLDQLISEGLLSKYSNNELKIDKSLMETMQSEIESSHLLEKRVFDSWNEELSKDFPHLAIRDLQISLRKYLAFAFQRHGIQTVSLINPINDIPDDYSQSLSSLLDKVIEDIFQPNQRVDAKNAISDFMAKSGMYPDRAKYISQLADGAFNYYNLSVPSDISEAFRKNLNDLTIFLDTNFLFGIIKLDISQKVSISNELVKLIKENTIPFKLVAHELTINELLLSISNYEQILKNRKWPPSISRAAASSRFVSGIEHRYHEEYSKTGIDVESFFNPFRHSDELIRDQGIEIIKYPEDTYESALDLIDQYKVFLEKRNRSKPYKIMQHDMTILNRVRLLRKNNGSTLNAGALFMTFDYSVYKFDWDNKENSISKGCTALPNLFLQLIRPYISANDEVDKAFAETFAIPEFRIIGSDSSKACTKMLNILSGYKDFPEETARRMLSNDLFIQNLQKIEEDKEFEKFVELQIVKENELLLTTNEEIQKELIKEKAEKEELTKAIFAQKEIESKTVLDLEASIQLLEQEKGKRLASEQKTNDISKTLQKTENELSGMKTFLNIFFIILTIALILLFELFAKSGSSRTVIPGHAAHQFRSMSHSESGVSRTL